MPLSLILFKKRTVLWPTPLAWCCLFASVLVGAVIFVYAIEPFLSVTRRVPAEALIAEGWIRREGLIASKKEFEENNYSYLVVTGGPNGPPWMERRWNFA